jgi:hypothetical protein
LSFFTEKLPKYSQEREEEASDAESCDDDTGKDVKLFGGLDYSLLPE